DIVASAAQAIASLPEPRQARAIEEISKGAHLAKASNGSTHSTRLSAIELGKLFVTLGDPVAVLKEIDIRRQRVGSSVIGVVRNRGDVARQLVAIWEDILGIRPIGLDDDFFGLGGDSVLAVTMLAKVERGMGITIPLTALLTATTVRQL